MPSCANVSFRSFVPYFFFLSDMNSFHFAGSCRDCIHNDDLTSLCPNELISNSISVINSALGTSLNQRWSPQLLWSIMASGDITHLRCLWMQPHALLPQERFCVGNGSLRQDIVLFYRVVKEEISDDNAKLPCFNGRVVSWVGTLFILESCSDLFVFMLLSSSVC